MISTISLGSDYVFILFLRPWLVFQKKEYYERLIIKSWRFTTPCAAFPYELSFYTSRCSVFTTSMWCILWLNIDHLAKKSCWSRHLQDLCTLNIHCCPCLLRFTLRKLMTGWWVVQGDFGSSCLHGWPLLVDTQVSHVVPGHVWLPRALEHSELRSLNSSFYWFNPIYLTGYPHKWWFCRNDDSILGNEIIGHADELWSSSANLIGSSPTKSHPFATSSPGTGIIADRSTSEQFNVEKEFKPFKSQPLVRSSNKTGPAGPKTEPLEEKVCTCLLVYAFNMARSFLLMPKRNALHSSFCLQTEDSTETSAETSASQSHIHNISSGIEGRFGDKVF